MKDNGHKDNGHADGDDLEALRRLLLGDEIERLERLRSQIEEPENFSRRVSEILPRAVTRSSERGEELSTAMMPTVEEIVRLSVKKDINRFADALFPVIGPAIRKSIRETMRQMMQSLNQTLEQGLSWRGLKWRIESWRSGIPFAQIALLHGLVYRVEQVFLIHRETGLLLCHLGQDDIHNQNPDLVSSMLAAINDFVGDSFALEAERSLNRIEVGEISIWLELGPDAILALAIRGEAPNGLRETMQRTLERVQAELADELAGFQSDTAVFEQREELLRDCLQAQYQPQRKGLSVKTIIFLLLLAAGLIYWIASAWQQHQQREGYLQRLAAEPGWVVTGSGYRDGVLVISGLRDPLARTPGELLSGAPFGADEVRHELRPYQALDDAIVERRARRALDAPEGVELNFDAGRLTVSGVADLDWRDRLRARLPLIAGISEYDDSALRIHFTPALLHPPAGVSFELEQGVLYVEGAAAQDWIDSLAAVPQRFAEVDSVDTRALVNLTEAELVDVIAELEKEVMLFDVATAVDSVSIDASRIGELARKIISLGGKLSRNVLIVVQGYSDSVGSFEDNVSLSRERANFVAQALFDSGIDPRYVAIRGLETPVATERSAGERRYNRRVEFEVIVE